MALLFRLQALDNTTQNYQLWKKELQLINSNRQKETFWQWQMDSRDQVTTMHHPLAISHHLLLVKSMKVPQQVQTLDRALTLLDTCKLALEALITISVAAPREETSLMRIRTSSQDRDPMTLDILAIIPCSLTRSLSEGETDVRQSTTQGQVTTRYPLSLQNSSHSHMMLTTIHTSGYDIFCKSS